MVTFVDAKTLTGSSTTFSVSNRSDQKIDASQFVVFPGLIDPHVHFRTPGLQEKEDWQTGAQAAVRGGYTTVFDMPNTIPPTITADLLRDKKELIDSQLQACHIPLRYKLFFGADKNHLDEIPKITHDAIGIKVFMGCSTGNLVIDDDESLHAVFAIAAQQNLIVAVHAEDEHLINLRKQQFAHAKNYSGHSEIRNEEVAAVAVEKAINLCRQYGTRLYILHSSTIDEINLIRDAKKLGLPVFAETTPHHLFLNTSFYKDLKGKAVVNPPLRDEKHQIALWEAVIDGTIDTIGSDHAPHLPAEKQREYGSCPSGMPGIETTLPLLLNACNEGNISLSKIIELTYTNPKSIFNLPTNSDKVLVDLNLTQEVKNANLKTKCGWSSFEGKTLKGWPKYTIIENQVFSF